MPRSRGFTPAVWLVLLVSVASSASAAGPFLVKDIDRRPVADAGASPQGFFDFGALTLFVGENQRRSRTQLWASDGTAAGTRLLHACNGCDGYLPLAPGSPGQALFLDLSLPTAIYTTNGTVAGTKPVTLPWTAAGVPKWIESLGKLFYLTVGGERRLGVSDGTPEGSIVLPFRAPDTPEDIVDFSGQAYFASHGGLFRSDGTETGTMLVKGFMGGPHNLLLLRDRLLFEADDGVSGQEPWVSDGTTAGTRRLKDIRQGAAGGGFIRPRIVGDRVFFAAVDDHGAELWLTDGTGPGTVRLSNFAPQYPFSLDGVNVGFNLVTLDGSVFFPANDGVHGMEVWTSNGTPGGTKLIKDVCPGACPGAPAWLESLGDALYFSGSDGSHGAEPWVSDGTPGRTRLVSDICRGSCSSSPLPLGALGDQVFLAARTGSEGIELWRTDGTSAGTDRLTNLSPDSPLPTFPLASGHAGGRLLFRADDGVHGWELWASDGTVAGTRLLKDLVPPVTDDAFPHELTTLGDQLFFFASDGVHGYELWKSDGTGPGTALVTEVLAGDNSIYSIGGLTAWRGKLFFWTHDEAYASWASDGTASGTVRLVNDPPSSGFVGVGDLVFFTTSQGLWKTDGTPAGTTLVANVPPSRTMAEYRGRLFFGSGTDLWTSDGTPEGTRLVRMGEAGFGLTDLDELTTAGDRLFYTGEGSLCVTDGTAEGTLRLKETAYIRNLTAAGSRLFFTAWDGEREQPWTSDGTPAGTRVVKQVVHGPLGFPPSGLVAVGETLFFIANDGIHGAELWKSDGTEAGTVLVRDIFPGIYTGFYSDLRPVHGKLMFSTNDGRTGGELWESDGTTAGTKRVYDLAPGIDSALPFEMTPVGPLVFFHADAEQKGVELWALCPADRPRVSVGDSIVREGDQGPVEARFTVTLTNPFCSRVTVDYATAGDTARAGSDFRQAQGRLSFPPGTTSLQVVVPILADNLREGRERFLLRLVRPTNASLGRREGRGTIEDDDGAAVPASTP